MDAGGRARHERPSRDLRMQTARQKATEEAHNTRGEDQTPPDLEERRLLKRESARRLTNISLLTTVLGVHAATRCSRRASGWAKPHR